GERLVEILAKRDRGAVTQPKPLAREINGRALEPPNLRGISSYIRRRYQLAHMRERPAIVRRLPPIPEMRPTALLGRIHPRRLRPMHRASRSTSPQAGSPLARDW